MPSHPASQPGARSYADDITLRRNLAFSEEAVLAKEGEEAMLYRDMQSDLVQQVMRRLAALKPQAPQ